jgi:hypothetical protein
MGYITCEMGLVDYRLVIPGRQIMARWVGYQTGTGPINERLAASISGIGTAWTGRVMSPSNLDRRRQTTGIQAS